MEFRNVVISKPARLSIRNSQLCIQQEEDYLLPIEDLCTLMLESRQILISAAALETLAVTEKQYQAIEILTGKPTVYDAPQTETQLMEF